MSVLPKRQEISRPRKRHECTSSSQQYMPVTRTVGFFYGLTLPLDEGIIRRMVRSRSFMSVWCCLPVDMSSTPEACSACPTNPVYVTKIRHRASLRIRGICFPRQTIIHHHHHLRTQAERLAAPVLPPSSLCIAQLSLLRLDAIVISAGHRRAIV